MYIFDKNSIKLKTQLCVILMKIKNKNKYFINFILIFSII